jgi:hypothetical protein
LPLTSRKGQRRAPIAAAARRSRVPEIDRLLSRWADPDRLNFIERGVLVERGFAAELQPTRRRGAKVSAKAKAALLLWELGDRQWLSTQEPSEAPALHGILLQRASLDRGAYVDGAAAVARSNASGDVSHWRRWCESHPAEYHSLLGATDAALERRSVLRIGRERYPLGERKHAREQYERLRNELGDAFVAGHVDREAAVRQWDKRRRDRIARDAAKVAGDDAPSLAATGSSTNLVVNMFPRS